MAVPSLEVLPDAEALTAAAVQRVIAACHHAVSQRGRFVIALAGGGTPRPVHRALAERHDLPWERVIVTFGDERHVPLDHPERNERAAREALLDHVPIRPEAILSWGEGADPEVLAAAHGDRLRFDLVMLGLGADAHTASLFPHAPSITARALCAVATAPDGSARLTLTPSALARAEEVLVLVSGVEKRDALRRSLARDGSADELPLTALEPEGRFVLLADAAAGGSAPADGVGVER
jgi:6-phosphogluconolactonase